MNKKRAFLIAFAITYIGISVGQFVKEGPPPEEAVFPVFFIGIPLLAAIGGGIGILIYPITQRIRENRARKREHVEQIKKVRKKPLSPREQLEKEKQEIIEMIDEALEEEKRTR